MLTAKMRRKPVSQNLLFYKELLTGKAKMCLRGGSFWKIVNKQLKNVNKFSKIEKNLSLLKRILALRSKMHCFKATALYFRYFSNRTPCMCFHTVEVDKICPRLRFYVKSI